APRLGLRHFPRGSRAGKPSTLAAAPAAAADPGSRAPRGGGRERRRGRGQAAPGRLRVQRRAASERGAVARRLGAPERLVEPLTPPVPLCPGLVVPLDI